MTTDYTTNFGLALPDFRMGPWHDLVNGNMIKVDQLIYGALSTTETLPWANNTAYATGTTAFDSDEATTWMCLIDHTSAPTGSFADERTAQPTYWTQLLVGFAPRGEWQHDTNYFPYDLAYQGSVGVLALCKTRHVSNSAGTIIDDKPLWDFLVDFSTLGAAGAVAVSYDPTMSGLSSTNVQHAIDELETQIVALNNVNITQGSQISALQTGVTNNANAITALGNSIAANFLNLAGNQTTTGGFAYTSKNLGNLISFIVDPMQGNYQYGANIGAFSISPPTRDCAVDILVTNGTGAGVISLIGFSVNPGNVGDALTTVVGAQFLISIRRIGGTSTYVVKALQ